MSEILKKMPSSTRHRVIYGIGIGNSVGFGRLCFLGKAKEPKKVEYLGEEREKRIFASALEKAKEELERLYGIKVLTFSADISAGVAFRLLKHFELGVRGGIGTEYNLTNAITLISGISVISLVKISSAASSSPV